MSCTTPGVLIFPQYYVWIRGVRIFPLFYVWIAGFVWIDGLGENKRGRKIEEEISKLIFDLLIV